MKKTPEQLFRQSVIEIMQHAETHQDSVIERNMIKVARMALKENKSIYQKMAELLHLEQIAEKQKSDKI